MLKQLLHRIKITPQVFQLWNKPVNRVVAVVTNRDGLSHLLARELAFKPFVAMTSSRYQVVLRRATFRDAPAEFTMLGSLIHLKNPYLIFSVLSF